MHGDYIHVAISHLTYSPYIEATTYPTENLYADIDLKQ